ncbi:MAG: asparagine synthase-related protein [Rhizomicrobium sp.]
MLYTDGRAVQNFQLDRCARALPDFGGQRADIYRSGSYGAAVRLYRITPEDRFERQPLVSRNGRWCIVFAGRLDNREELARALAIPSSVLRQTPDSALCLSAFDAWGETAPERLAGGFSLALWDEPQRRLFLCRDRMGERPLFYHQASGFIAFSTSFNGILAFPEVPRALDETIVGDMLAQNFFEQDRTLYRGIHRVRSASLAVFAAGKIAERSYWRPARRPLGLASHADYVEAARHELERAVAVRLRSAHPPAAQASGGLDSSGVAATAALLLKPAELEVYTRVPPLGFAGTETPRRYFDERSRVRALARLHPNMRLNLVETAGLHRFDLDAGRLFATAGVFVLNPDNLGWFASLYDAVSAGGHRVLLSGDLGNFSLGWRGRNSLALLLKAGRFARLAKDARTLSRLTSRSLLGILRGDVLSAFEPEALRRLRRRASGKGEGLEAGAFVDPVFMRDYRLRERVRDLGGWNSKYRKGDSFERRTRWLVDGNEISRDFMGQFVGLFGFESRAPLADPRLIEFCLNIPEEHFLHRGRPRSLQRDVIADRVPPDIHENYRLGDQNPEWFSRLAARHAGILQDVERISRSPLASAMIDMKRLKRAFENWPSDAQDPEGHRTELLYGAMRAVNIGRFIRWFEGGNA